jgi:5-methylcytosine-specific restriction endonuclease McrA
MTWRGPRKPRDPLLDTPLFRANRAQLKRLRLPCAICGRVIDYTQSGAFVAGHIVSRRKAKLLGWTPAQINALSNLRPECRSCSNKTGAREGQQAQRAKLKRQAKIGMAATKSAPRGTDLRIFDTSRDW